MIPLLLAALAQAVPPKVVLLETPEGARQPQIAVRILHPPSDVDQETPPAIRRFPQREVYVVYGTPNSVQIVRSTNKGATFEPPRTIAQVGALALGYRRGPRVVVVGNTILVTAIAGEKGRGQDEDLRSWHSIDRGETWSDDGRIHEAAGAAREGLHALARGINGQVFCAWIDLAEGEPRICGALSSIPYLGRWGETRVVYGDASGICPCCAPSTAIDAKGRIYVMWRGNAHGARDMVVAWSDDQGATFSEPRKIGTGTWPLEACPMDGGGIEARSGRLRSVWRRESDIFLAQLGDAERKIGEGEQPCLVWTRADEFAAWVERRGGPLMVLRTTGAAKPIRLDEKANDPVLYAEIKSGMVFAAWETGAVDAPRIAFARID